ncbi:hypothetical protein P7C73_g1314, partial [Tremellales sp. Uapishka_1]
MPNRPSTSRRAKTSIDPPPPPAKDENDEPVSSGLGLEDEMSFGSDEDVMQRIGEIKLPPTSVEEKKKKSRLKGKEKEKERIKTGMELTMMAPPQDVMARLGVEDVRDGRKKGSLINALKGFGKKRKEEASKATLSVGNPSESSFGSRSAESSRPQSTVSSPTLSAPRPYGSLSNRRPSTATTDRRPSATSTLSLSNRSLTHLVPFSSTHSNQLPSSTTQGSLFSKLTGSRSASSTSLVLRLGTATHTPSTLASSKPTPRLDRTTSHSSSGFTQPSVTSSSTFPNANYSMHPHSAQSALSSILLPSLPASLSSLESIQILSAMVIKRNSAGSISGVTPEKRSFTSGFRPSTSGSSAAPSFGYRSRPIWTSQQLILTSFKVGGSTPQTSPDPNIFASPGSIFKTSAADSMARTIAHLHCFSTTAGASPNRPNTATSMSGGKRPTTGQGLQMGQGVEVERKELGMNCTAGVWAEGAKEKRICVMKVCFGEEEGGGECEQLQEWISQIQSIAVVIKAENLEFGQAIRKAYNKGTVQGGDLALDPAMRSEGLRSPANNAGIPQINLKRASGYSDLFSPDRDPRSESPGSQLPMPMTDFLMSLTGERRLSQDLVNEMDLEYRTELARKKGHVFARPESPDLLPPEEPLDGLGIDIGVGMVRSRSYDEPGVRTAQPPPPRTPKPVLRPRSRAAPDHESSPKSLSRRNTVRSRHSTSSIGSQSTATRHRSFPPAKPAPAGWLPLPPTPNKRVNDDKERSSSPTVQPDNPNAPSREASLDRLRTADIDGLPAAGRPTLAEPISIEGLPQSTPSRTDTGVVRSIMRPHASFYHPDTSSPSPPFSPSTNLVTPSPRITVDSQGGAASPTSYTSSQRADALEGKPKRGTDSDNASLASGQSGSLRARRGRHKPAAIDIMAEMNALEAEMYPQEREEEILENRPRAIRFAEE